MTRKFYFLYIALLFVCTSNAQQELGLHMMHSIGQAGITNPAIVPDKKIFVGIAGVAFNYHHTAGSINDLIKTNGGRTILDLDELIALAEPENDLDINLELETFRVHYQLGNINLSLNHAIKSNVFIRYSDALPKLFWQGNAQFIGEQVSFGPEQQSFAYNELGLGAAVDLGKISIGGRVKYLSGIGDASTDRELASLRTDDDIYQLDLETDYRINTSLFSPTFLFDSIGGVGLEYGFDDIFDFNNLFEGNSGIAFDLGLTFQATEKIQVAVSVVDIGKINWRENITNYTSQGSFEYEGIDISNILGDDEISFNGSLDTLQEIFNFTETSAEYSNNIPAKVYASLTYQLNDLWEVGGMYYSRHFRGNNDVAFAVSANTAIGKYFKVGATYGMRNERFDHLGMNVIANLGKVQVYAVTDNIIGMVNPYNSENVNGRIGLNLLFE